MRATPPEISTVSEPVSGFTVAVRQGDEATLGAELDRFAAASDSSDLLPPSVTISVRVSLSRLTALAASAEPPAASKSNGSDERFPHVQYPVFPPPLLQFARHSRPLHGELIGDGS